MLLEPSSALPSCDMEGSNRMAGAYGTRAVSHRPGAWAELPRAQHAFDVLGTPRATAAAVAVGRFLGVVYGEHVEASRADRTGS